MNNNTPLVLVILDGWGYREERANNAIASANTPQWDEWWSSCPHILLDASGHQVGLPDKQMGNSEVGHMHIGAGRVIPQDFTRINEAIASGEFANNPVFLELIQDMKQQGKNLHVMGLLSSGGVHSHENHLFAFLALCHELEFNQVCLHLFLDGRDTPPQSALGSIALLKQVLEKHPIAQICSITGRYFAMDRDQRWERLAPVYKMLTEGESHYQFETPEAAIEFFYAENKFDEFIPPTVIAGFEPIEEGDAIFFFNFRADRARQLTRAFIDESFDGFIRAHQPALAHFVSMTRYSKHLLTECAFPPMILHNTLGEVLANEGLSQLRIAETEKYAHVTFFFSGGSEQIFPNEDRILIPSPPVATYDLLPEMSAPALTRTLVNALESEAYDVVICNYANADMVGHTGDFNAAVKAIECLDECLKEVGQAVLNKGGVLLITADHGNAETMFDEQTTQAHTAHTSQPVPLLFIDGKRRFHFIRQEGSLIDIAPTILALLNIEQPSEMTGQALLVENE
ncbi:2,3-bisphosphoglycerate-independent phosphoglycerate mutase [Legionella jordanis]|uniref:2,3-bisphosphoglycerate-independent phosphoglycerate mutase n=1 Tax=Legionella jordanis TaxID=456 RepID=A0A0W0VBT0_9GAMM|nr:2,3-bisphosphoglycerate-independent phosphoglycerate mutase [Legionella jordanis]KTD17341.1 phosphoglyceromutase [Legionella jordanis]RMX01891.1 2,3-bisphosphoglycerate-independent phosphoglycerate mutase [Legionella jordanis]VEH11642.1 phosphoglycerate mutase [Legionella jordanis]